MDKLKVNVTQVLATPTKNTLPEKSTKSLSIQGKDYSYDQIVVRYGADFPKTVMLNRITITEAVNSMSPSIAKISNAFGQNASIGMIKIWLVKLNDFYPKGALTLEQLDDLAVILFGEYYFLTCTEIAVCINNIKAGKYGEMYGDIDPLKITHSFAQFAKERRQAIEISEREKKHAQQEANRIEWAKEAVTYEVALRKWKKSQKREMICRIWELTVKVKRYENSK